MLTRHLFLKLSENRPLRSWMETSPKAKLLTRRFIAGETLDDELRVCAQLQAQNMSTALDHLGENVTTLDDARQSAEAYEIALDEIAARRLPATVSIKVTQFGVDISEDACLENVLRLVARAKATGSRVEIDMESSRYTDRTLNVAERAAATGPVRCVIQAYLRRSAADVDRMNRLGVPVRLCKGAYDEPETVAFPGKAAVAEHYVQLMKKLMDEGNFPAIATHDPTMHTATIKYARLRGIAADRFEFQMLYGIRRDLQKKLLDQGYHLRLYVPYGTAWYPYFMRRLAERPANVLFVARSFFH
jgi:proline dehydrogenase